MEPDDLLFRGVELEEPSRRTDEAVLTCARGRLAEIRGTRSTSASLISLWIHGGLAAGLVLGLFLILAGDQKEAGRHGPVLAARGPAAPAITIRDVLVLKEEFVQIREMSDLIPEDLKDQKETIADRIRVCLASLDALEEKLLKSEDSSIPQESDRKEVRI